MCVDDGRFVGVECAVNIVEEIHAPLLGNDDPSPPFNTSGAEELKKKLHDVVQFVPDNPKHDVGGFEVIATTRRPRAPSYDDYEICSLGGGDDDVDNDDGYYEYEYDYNDDMDDDATPRPTMRRREEEPDSPHMSTAADYKTSLVGTADGGGGGGRRRLEEEAPDSPHMSTTTDYKMIDIMSIAETVADGGDGMGGCPSSPSIVEDLSEIENSLDNEVNWAKKWMTQTKADHEDANRTNDALQSQLQDTILENQNLQARFREATDELRTSALQVQNTLRSEIQNLEHNQATVRTNQATVAKLWAEEMSREKGRMAEVERGMREEMGGMTKRWSESKERAAELEREVAEARGELTRKTGKAREELEEVRGRHVDELAKVVSDLMDQHKVEMDGVIKEKESVVERDRADHDRAAAALREEGECVRNKLESVQVDLFHEKRAVEVKSEEIQTMAARHEEELRTQLEEKAKAVSDLESLHRSKMEILSHEKESKAEREIQTMIARHEEELWTKLEEKAKDISNLEDLHRSKIEGLTKEKEGEVARERTNHNLVATGLGEELDSVKNDLKLVTDELSDAKESIQVKSYEILAMTTRHEDVVTQLRGHLETTVSSLEDAHRTEMNENISNLKDLHRSKIEDLTKQNELEVERERTNHNLVTKGHDLLAKGLREDLESVQNDLKLVTEELSDAKESTQVKSDEILAMITRHEEELRTTLEEKAKDISNLEDLHRLKIEELTKEKEGEAELERTNHNLLATGLRQELESVQNELKLIQEELSDAKESIQVKSDEMLAMASRHEEELRTTLEENSKDISNLEELHRLKIEGLTKEKEGEAELERTNHNLVAKEIGEELESVQNELKLIKEELSDAKESIQIKSDEILTTTARHEEVVTELRGHLETTVSDLEDAHGTEMDELRNEKEDEAERETTNHNLVVKALRDELGCVRNEVESVREELSDAREEVDVKSEQISTMTARHEEEVMKINDYIETTQNDLEEERGAVHDLDLQLESVRQELSKVRKADEDKSDQIRSTTMRYEEKVRELQEHLKSSRNDLEKERRERREAEDTNGADHYALRVEIGKKEKEARNLERKLEKQGVDNTKEINRMKEHLAEMSQLVEETARERERAREEVKRLKVQVASKNEAAERFRKNEKEAKKEVRTMQKRLEASACEFKKEAGDKGGDRNILNLAKMLETEGRRECGSSVPVVVPCAPLPRETVQHTEVKKITSSRKTGAEASKLGDDTIMVQLEEKLMASKEHHKVKLSAIKTKIQTLSTQGRRKH